MSINSLNRIRYYYENILRNDFLLKFNYTNIMKALRVYQIFVIIHDLGSREKNSASRHRLALELICGQKAFCCEQLDASSKSAQRKKLKMKHASFSNAQRGAQRLNSRGTIVTNNVNAKKPSIKSKKSNKDFLKGFLKANSGFLYCSLRTYTMYNFLEKVMTILSVSYEHKINIQPGEIQITLNSRDVRLFPEVQNHFEYFENLPHIQIKILTSTENEMETQNLWTALNTRGA